MRRIRLLVCLFYYSWSFGSSCACLAAFGSCEEYGLRSLVLRTTVYDGDGNRVSETVGSTTTEYLIDNLNPTGYAQIMDELVSGSVTRTYTYGLQRISENQLVGSTWTPSFYGYDGHGNVRFLTNTSGAVGDTHQFDAFGMQIASTGTTGGWPILSALILS
jgi:hypothetical protein